MISTLDQARVGSIRLTGRIVGKPEAIQKRASQESMDDLTEPDFRLTPNSVSAEHR